MFGLLIPVINASKSRTAFARLVGFLAIAFFIVTYFQSGFTIDKKKPNSLVYVKNMADSVAYWGTYNQVLDPFITQKLGENPTKGGIAAANTKSKYNTRFSYHAKATNISIPNAVVSIEKDTLIEENRVGIGAFTSPLLSKLDGSDVDTRIVVSVEVVAVLVVKPGFVVVTV